MSKNTPVPSNTNSSDIRQLVNYLKRTRGIDYSSYKPSTLERRIRKRIQMLGLEQYEDYIDYLEVHPDEFNALFNHILINVTDFFRDEPAWHAISNNVVPRILAEKKPGESVRVWSAGCASGEEAYTIAMVLREAMGDISFRQSVKIYATDVDEEALNEARLAVYSPEQVKSVPAALREKYFENINGSFAFKKEMRRSVIFGRHDLLTDAPISHIDLLICRNTLMYFNIEAQLRILSRFNFALNNNGLLFLGKAEVMAARSQNFLPIDLKSRVFVKIARPSSENDEDGSLDGESITTQNTDDAVLQNLSLDVDVMPQIVVNAKNELVVINAPARALLGLRLVGHRQRLQDLMIAYRPIELRHIVDQVNVEHSMLQQRNVKWILPNGEEHFFDVSALPLIDTTGNLQGVKITFNDVTSIQKLQSELQHLQHDLETMNEELQSANEELETTNEELQSTNEELETMNEELQSSNEELETMNEELQSTNEELATVNDELRQRGQDLNRTNGFLESVMYGIREGLIVLDRDLRVLTWNRMAQEMWGLRAEEVAGQHFFNLDIGLPVDKLSPLIRATLNDGNWDNMQETTLPAINRRGRQINVMVTVTPLMEGETQQGIILVIKALDSDPKAAAGGKGDDPAL